MVLAVRPTLSACRLTVDELGSASDGSGGRRPRQQRDSGQTAFRATVSSSPPETVARVIAHALTTNRPRARYVATPDARIMLAIVPRLSDRKRDTLWGWLLGLREMRTAG